MLKIRLQRTGRKHEPTFRVVLTEHQNGPKSGKFKEILGSYDPRKNEVNLKPDEIKKWIAVGAQPSDTVNNLLVSQKVIEGKKINVLPKKSPIVKEDPSTEAQGESQDSEEKAEAPVEGEEVAEHAAEGEAEAAPADKPKEEEKKEEAPVEEEKKEEEKTE